MLNKLNAISLNNDFLFEYLVDTLYFFLRHRNDHKYQRDLVLLLTKCLENDITTSEQNNSIFALMSMMVDLKMDINFETTIMSHFQNHKNSKLDISALLFSYPKLGITTSIHNHKHRVEIQAISFEEFLHNILDDATFHRNLPHYASIISQTQFEDLLALLHNDNIEALVKTRLLQIMFFSSRCNITYAIELLKVSKSCNSEQKFIINNMLCDIKSKKLPILLNNLDIDNSTFIRIALKHYDPIFYKEIHKRIRELKINYANTDMWYEVESSLISYFRKKSIDLRMLDEIRYFLHNGLSSYSRYKLACILNIYGQLSSTEIQALELDANYKTRRLARNLK